MLSRANTRVVSALGRRNFYNYYGVQSTHKWKRNQSNPWGSFQQPQLFEHKRGKDVIDDPLLNKGTSFPYPERDRLGLRGLVPPRQLTMKTQMSRVLNNFRALKDDLERHVFLNDLHDRNETLFYKLLTENIAEMAPIVYTPTVGQACIKFGERFRRPRGMYFSSADRGQMSAMVYNWPGRDVDVIVVTDGSRILGLGDLGAHGMGIPIGKLSLYVAAAGLHPGRVLPAVIDVGTNNERLLQDPFYLGMQHRRLQGDEYYSLIDEFMAAARHRWPNVLVQFEDFSSDHAATVLNKYRHDHLCFNDDIQGTGAVTVGTMLSALRVLGKKPEALKEQRVVVVGAGSAGVGVTEALRDSMVSMGLTSTEANLNFWMLDRDGLLGKSRANVQDLHKPYLRHDLPDKLPLIEVIRAVRPTVLLGLSTCRGLFTPEVLQEMAKHVDRPIIFSLSNPTNNSECSAEEAYLHTGGRALFASGSPYEPVTVNGRRFVPSQCNNMYIFPGLGLGAVACGAEKINDDMFLAAAKALAETLSADEANRGQLLPNILNIRSVSAHVAVRVIECAVKTGVANFPAPEGLLHEYVMDKMYRPEYSPLVSVPYLDDGGY
eukprot:GILI01003392.1.p1 GENE.GILI01003392.1~~GILI01003392.1.p1  ORF type:complete len:630 (-),score=119.73 GILI01003392.1:342-2150(-)